MRAISVFSRLAIVLCLAMALCACKKGAVESESAIPNPIPASKPFAKIKPGWTMKQVRDTIGAPTDTRTFTTGMASYVPFLSGSSDYRAEDFYKGQGRIVYAGSSDMGVQSYGVLQIIYNEEESGYADKSAYPDGPHNKPKSTSSKRSKRSSRQASSAAKAPAAASTQTSAPATAQPAAPAPTSAPSSTPKNDPLSGL